MIALQVHITAGPTAGQRLQLNTSPITFGRAPDSALVLDLPVVSRNHGELREIDGQWMLINHSQNGTRLGRKRVTTKPRPLTDGAPIIIGDEQVFVVNFVQTGPTPDVDEYDSDDDEADARPATPTGKNRSKLWIGLGVWFAICIGMFIFFATLGGDDGPGDDGRGGITDFTTAEQVQDAISLPAEPATPDNYAYTENLKRARDAFLRGRDEDMYTAYRFYREAERYLDPGKKLEPIDQQNMLDAENKLTTLVFELFVRARNELKAQQYEQCLETIDRLRDIYRNENTDHPLMRSINAMRKAASDRVR